MNEFPKSDNKYLKGSDFQDQRTELTFVDWDKKANEDDPEDRKNPRTWKEKVKYTLRYSYPQWATDEVGDKRVGSDGKPFENKNWDPNYPHGYSVIYKFEEGELDSGSLPLFNAFCKVRPQSGDRISILRTGVDKDTKWQVKKVTGLVPTEEENCPF